MDIRQSFKQLQEIDLSELDFNTIGVWPLPVRIILLVILFVAVLAGAYYFHISDLNQNLENQQKREVELKKEFEEKAFEAANLEAYRAQMLEVEAAFEALLAQLPSDTEVPGLLEDITEIGHGSSLDIQSITLQQERAAEFYVELPIRFVARGGYHDFGSFVSGVSSLPRIVTLHDFSITRGRGSSALQFEVLAKTYRYKSQGE